MIRSASEVPLRAIIVSACPAHCQFCHFEGGPRNGRELSIEEIDAMSEVAASLAVQQIQLTGGEPLLRRDVPQIIKRILDRHPSAKVSVTTNGFFLDANLGRVLSSSGLSKMNVSLVPWLFEVCGIDKPEEVESGIERLVRLLSPFAERGSLEFNFTVMRDWLDYLPYLLAASARFHVLLDLMTVGWHPGFRDEWYAAAYVEPATVVKSCLAMVEDVALRFGATPYLELVSQDRVLAKLKDPAISRQFHLRECPDCPFSARCPETSCAVRAYPGWRVGTCLLDLQRGTDTGAATERRFRQRIVQTYADISEAIDELAFLRFLRTDQFLQPDHGDATGPVA